MFQPQARDLKRHFIKKERHSNSQSIYKKMFIFGHKKCTTATNQDGFFFKLPSIFSQSYQNVVPSCISWNIFLVSYNPQILNVFLLSIFKDCFLSGIYSYIGLIFWHVKWKILSTGHFCCVKNSNQRNVLFMECEVS